MVSLCHLTDFTNVIRPTGSYSKTPSFGSFACVKVRNQSLPLCLCQAVRSIYRFTVNLPPCSSVDLLASFIFCGHMPKILQNPNHPPTHQYFFWLIRKVVLAETPTWCQRVLGKSFDLFCAFLFTQYRLNVRCIIQFIHSLIWGCWQQHNSFKH